MTDLAGLYVVATPIGNMADMSKRAIETLQAVDCIAAEDTRHSKPLLNRYGIDKPMLALHDHNEEQQAGQLLLKLEQGQKIALISDAGTPLISDPGYVLVNVIRDAGFPVVAIPGPSALTAALSIAGMPTHQFTFWGFLPAKSHARREILGKIKVVEQTSVFYESTHRLIPALEDIIAVCGQDREIAIAKELTKKHENIIRGKAVEVLAELQEDVLLQKGEFVIIVEGQRRSSEDKQLVIDRHLHLFLPQVPVKLAVKFTVELTGMSKNQIYERALQLNEQ